MVVPERPTRRSGSDSLAQREAEIEALKIVAKSLDLANIVGQQKFKIGEAMAVVDAFSETIQDFVLIEVNARVETVMKTATKNKVLKDTLKMMLIEKTYAEQWKGKRVRKILIFLDAVARKSFGPKAWPNQAWIAFGVETYVCTIPTTFRDALIKAQKSQDLRAGI